MSCGSGLLNIADEAKGWVERADRDSGKMLLSTAGLLALLLIQRVLNFCTGQEDDRLRLAGAYTRGDIRLAGASLQDF